MVGSNPYATAEENSAELSINAEGVLYPSTRQICVKSQPDSPWVSVGTWSGSLESTAVPSPAHTWITAPPRDVLIFCPWIEWFLTWGFPTLLSSVLLSVLLARVSIANTGLRPMCCNVQPHAGWSHLSHSGSIHRMHWPGSGSKSLDCRRPRPFHATHLPSSLLCAVSWG